MSACVVGISSGKGGTGKSLLAANVGVYLASLGKKVVLVDASLGSASLHTFLGVSEVERGLGTFWADEKNSLADVVSRTQVKGLELISGAGDPAWAADPRKPQLERLIDEIRQLDADFVVVDLASGTRASTLELWLSSDKQLLVATADPTAIELGYRLVRASFLIEFKRMGLGHWIQRGSSPKGDHSTGLPGELIDRVYAGEDKDEISGIRKIMSRFRPLWVMNILRSKSDDDLGPAIEFAASHRLGVPMRILGAIQHGRRRVDVTADDGGHFFLNILKQGQASPLSKSPVNFFSKTAMSLLSVLNDENLYETLSGFAYGEY